MSVGSLSCGRKIRADSHRLLRLRGQGPDARRSLDVEVFHEQTGEAKTTVDIPEVRRHLTWMRTRVSSKGQIVLPAEMRKRDGIGAGQEFEIERIDRGEYRLSRHGAPPNESLVDWLLACPEKGFFTALASESTDTL